MNKTILEHNFHLFYSSKEKMYKYDTYCLEIINNIYKNKKLKENTIFLKEVEAAFHDIPLIKEWIHYTLSEFHKFKRSTRKDSNIQRKSGISCRLFFNYLETDLQSIGYLNKKKLPIIKRLLTLEQLMNVFSKGEPFFDVPGVDSTRVINGVKTRIKHSAFPHLLQLHYLNYCSKKYRNISIDRVKSLFKSFAKDKEILETAYVPLFDNVGIHNNFTNPHFISCIARTFFNLPSNYHEFLFSDMSIGYFGKNLNKLKAIEVEKKNSFVYYIFPKDMSENFIAEEFISDANCVTSLNSEYVVFDVDFFIRCVDENKPLAACFVHFDKFSFPVNTVYRSYIIGTKYYRVLYNYLKINHNLILVNSPAESKFAHLIPNWKDRLGIHFSDTFCKKFDPKRDSLDHLIEKIRTDSRIPKQKYILKDYNKSEKEHWESSALVDLRNPDKELKRQLEQFLYWRGRNFEGGICLRKFMEYSVIQPKGKVNLFPSLPEYRIYVFKGKIIYLNKRYPALDYEIKTSSIRSFLRKTDLNAIIKTTFFAVDIVRTDHGQFDIIEIDDAQFCGVFESKTEFYKRLNKSVANH